MSQSTSEHDAAAPARMPTQSGAANDRCNDRRRYNDRPFNNHARRYYDRIGTAKAAKIAMPARTTTALGTSIETRKRDCGEHRQRKRLFVHLFLMWFDCPQNDNITAVPAHCDGHHIHGDFRARPAPQCGLHGLSEACQSSIVDAAEPALRFRASAQGRCPRAVHLALIIRANQPL